MPIVGIEAAAVMRVEAAHSARTGMEAAEREMSAAMELRGRSLRHANRA